MGMEINLEKNRRMGVVSKIDVVRAAMMAAMKSKDKARKDALSMLLSVIKNAQIDNR